MIYRNKSVPLLALFVQSQYLSHCRLFGVLGLAVANDAVFNQFVAEGATELLLPIVLVVRILLHLARGGTDVVVIGQLADEVDGLQDVHRLSDHPELVVAVYLRESQTNMVVPLDHVVHLVGRSLASD